MIERRKCIAGIMLQGGRTNIRRERGEVTATVSAGERRMGRKARGIVTAGSLVVMEIRGRHGRGWEGRVKGGLWGMVRHWGRGGWIWCWGSCLCVGRHR
jgi:hypothetical protein